MTLTPETIAELRALLAKAPEKMTAYWKAAGGRQEIEEARDFYNAVRDELPALLDTAEREAELEAEHSVSVTVGHGLRVYGSMEAISRVQQYILLGSSHPVEANDVRRMLAKDLQAAEAKIASLEAENAKLRGLLRPFAKEAEAWVSRTEGGTYDDSDQIVEPFPGYQGELNVGDLRRAAAALKGDKA